MPTKKVRAYVLARELRMSNEKFMRFMHEKHGILITSHMTPIKASIARKIREMSEEDKIEYLKEKYGKNFQYHLVGRPKRYNVSIDRELYIELKKIALEHDCSVRKVAVEVLKNYIRK